MISAVPYDMILTTQQLIPSQSIHWSNCFIFWGRWFKVPYNLNFIFCSAILLPTNDSSWRAAWTSLLGSTDKSHCSYVACWRCPFHGQSRRRNHSHLNRENWVCGWRSGKPCYNSLRAIQSSYHSHVKTERDLVWKRNGIYTEWCDHSSGLCVTSELKLRLSET